MEPTTIGVVSADVLPGWISQGGITRYPNAMWGTFLPSAAVVWLALQRFANLRDGARPTIDTVMAMTGLKRSAVKAAIARELVPAGVLIVIPRDRGSQPNRYEFPDQGESFTEWPNFLWGLGLKPPQIIVLLALLRVKDLPNGATPKICDIASQTRTGKDTVRRALDELQQMGLIAVDRRGTTRSGRKLSDRYTFPCLETATSVVPESDHPRTRERPPPYLRATTPVPESDHEEDLSKKTDERRLIGRRLREHRAARGDALAVRDSQPPAAEPGTEANDVGVKHEGGGHIRIEQPHLVHGRKSTVVSSSKFRNILRESADAETVVKLWETLREPAPSAKARMSWVAAAGRLMAEGRPLDEVLQVVRWVHADGYWSTRLRSPVSLNPGGANNGCYDDLQAEVWSREPKAPCVDSRRVRP